MNSAPTEVEEAVGRLAKAADQAQRYAGDGWRLFSDVPTPEMTEALERCESYCDSCHGTAFSGWSGYEALFRSAPSDLFSVADLRLILSALSDAHVEIIGLRADVEAAHAMGRSLLVQRDATIARLQSESAKDGEAFRMLLDDPGDTYAEGWAAACSIAAQIARTRLAARKGAAPPDSEGAEP